MFHLYSVKDCPIGQFSGKKMVVSAERCCPARSKLNQWNRKRTNQNVNTIHLNEMHDMSTARKSSSSSSSSSIPSVKGDETQPSLVHSINHGETKTRDDNDPRLKHQPYVVDKKLQKPTSAFVLFSKEFQQTLYNNDTRMSFTEKQRQTVNTWLECLFCSKNLSFVVLLYSFFFYCVCWFKAFEACRRKAEILFSSKTDQ